ncbi:unnamed protein product [Lactuca virosa]|uniref:Uncharacterized protein n=1 Tax=Lactuca virosa TaxID=75947 RepID=A0AAU9NIW2_9ASTR|nr:unnamed protein product [Lactuca virosa]
MKNKNKLNSTASSSYDGSVPESGPPFPLTNGSSNQLVLPFYFSRVWIREGNRSDVPLTQPGNGPEGTAAWGMSASHRKAHFKLWVIGRAALSDQGPGHKGPSTIQVRRSPEVTAMSRNLTHRPKRRANTRT